MRKTMLPLAVASLVLSLSACGGGEGAGNTATVNEVATDDLSTDNFATLDEAGFNDTVLNEGELNTIGSTDVPLDNAALETGNGTGNAL